MLNNFLKNCKITKVNARATSAGTAINTSSVDMAGFGGVVFIGQMDTANAGNSANVAQSADDTTFADLAGTAVVTGDDADSFAIDVKDPTDRYVRCEIDRSGANTAVGEIYAIQYDPRKAPVSQGATIDGETHVGPAEGTA